MAVTNSCKDSSGSDSSGVSDLSNSSSIFYGSPRADEEILDERDKFSGDEDSECFFDNRNFPENCYFSSYFANYHDSEASTSKVEGRIDLKRRIEHSPVANATVPYKKTCVSAISGRLENGSILSDILTLAEKLSYRLMIGKGFLLQQEKTVLETRQKLLSSFLNRRVQKDLKFQEETIHLTACIFDQCLDLFSIDCETGADLFAVSFILASKLEEYESARYGHLIKLGLTTSTDVCRLAVLEKKVLFELNYTINIPTRLWFAQCYCDFYVEWMRDHFEVVEFLLRLSLFDPCTRDFDESTIAMSTLALAAIAIDTTSARIALRLPFEIYREKLPESQLFVESIISQLANLVLDDLIVVTDIVSKSRIFQDYEKIKVTYWDMIESFFA